MWLLAELKASRTAGKGAMDKGCGERANGRGPADANQPDQTQDASTLLNEWRRELNAPENTAGVPPVNKTPARTQPVDTPQQVVQPGLLPQELTRVPTVYPTAQRDPGANAIPPS